jgi:hypothetical protein
MILYKLTNMSDNWDDWDCDNYEITVLNMEQSKYIEERKLVEESDNKIANQLFGFETDKTNETDETDEKQNSIANSNKFKPIREKRNDIINQKINELNQTEISKKNKEIKIKQEKQIELYGKSEDDEDDEYHYYANKFY